ncbi:MAG: DUF6569 family protein [Chryseolinea sp.]
MKTTISITVVIVIVLLCIRVYHTPGQPSVNYYHQVVHNVHVIYHPENLRIKAPSEKHHYGNLQLYPIFASSFFLEHHQHLGPYLSLQEALKQKKIIITELSDKNNQQDTTVASVVDSVATVFDEAEVNRLFVENIFSDTIIILGGEVVQGGKQDRMIAQDFMVLPHSGKLDIAVYCVEHGRWTYSDESTVFATTMNMAPPEVRRAADAPAAQEKVWDKVAEMTSKMDAPSPTGALAFAVADGKMQEPLLPYKKHFESIEWPEDVVGVIAVMGNKIVALDIFAQHQLFTRYYPNLLSSYISDAHAVSDSTTMPYAEVESFLSELINNDAALDKHIQQRGTQLKHHGYRIHVATYGESDDDEPTVRVDE